MRKFRFNLQKLLDHRTMLEENLLAELAGIQAEQDREETLLESMVEERERHEENVKILLTGKDAEEIKTAFNYWQYLSRRELLQKVKIEDISKRKESKRLEVIEASKERKTLELLKDHKVEEHHRECALQEQKFLDDIGTIQHARSASKDPAGVGR